LAFEIFSPVIPSDSSALEHRLGYTFRDQALLARALTHPSYLQSNPEAGESNQRLEFLGDAVLQLVLTTELFAVYPQDREGALSKRRAALTKGGYLSQLARNLGLDACLRLSPSEEQTGGRDRASALEDAFEALVGALFLDSDFSTVRRVLLGLYGPLAERVDEVVETENPKGRLQELIQPDHGNSAVRYVTQHVSGEDHAREYEAKVYLHEELLGTGRGPSKKTAEEAAAISALAARQIF